MHKGAPLKSEDLFFFFFSKLLLALVVFVEKYEQPVTFFII